MAQRKWVYGRCICRRPSETYLPQPPPRLHCGLEKSARAMLQRGFPRLQAYPPDDFAETKTSSFTSRRPTQCRGATATSFVRAAASVPQALLRRCAAGFVGWFVFPFRKKFSKRMETEKRGCSNFKWTKNISRFFVEFLADQARAGMKVDKCFKSVAMIAAAKAINQTFPHVTVSETNCVNHYRTLKNRWGTIKKLKDLSGVSWDDTTKTIVMGHEQYNTYIAAHSSADPYINKPIEQYDEMSLICGDDYATGAFARSIGGANITPTTTRAAGPSDLNHDDMDTSQGIPAQVQTANASSSRLSGAKRSRNRRDEKEACIAVSIDNLSKSFDPQTWSDRLYAAIQEMTEFDDDIKDQAYEFLMLNKSHGQMFLSRNNIYRARWMHNYLNGSFSRPRGSELN